MEKEEEENSPIIKHERRKKKRKKTQQEEPIEEPLQQDTQMEEEEPKSAKKAKKKKKKKEKLDATVKIIHEHPDKIAPIVAYFPSGYNPEQDTEEDKPEITTYRKKGSSRAELVVTPKQGSWKVNFVGNSHSGEASFSQVCNYALGVLDKETGILRIVPIVCNKLLRLEPRTGSFAKEQSKELKEEDTTPLEKAEKMRVLTSAYGTKKANIKDKKIANLNRKEDAKTQKALDDKLEDVKLNKEALETTGGNPTRNIPHHDSAADTPEKAYPLDRIILSGEWDYLLDILDLMQSGSEITQDIYPSFVCNRIHKLLGIEDEEERKKLACIYQYITHLIKFKDQRSAGASSSAKNHRIPAILNKKFLALFADPEKFTFSPEKLNLLISYVLVLTLIADGHRTEISDIKNDLKMRGQLRQHYENLGCKFKREGNLMLATLPTPLEFPKLRMKRHKK